jgi:hypothetical protein
LDGIKLGESFEAGRDERSTMSPSCRASEVTCSIMVSKPFNFAPDLGSRWRSSAAAKRFCTAPWSEYKRTNMWGDEGFVRSNESCSVFSKKTGLLASWSKVTDSESDDCKCSSFKSSADTADARWW